MQETIEAIRSTAIITDKMKFPSEIDNFLFRTEELYSDAKSLAVDTKGKGARIMEYRDSTHGICRFSLPETETA